MTATTSPITIPFLACELTGTLGHDDEQRHLVLWTDEGPEDLATGLASYGLVAPAGHVYIKDWTEHSGLASAMQEQGLVQIVDSVRVGPFSLQAYLVKVLI